MVLGEVCRQGVSGQKRFFEFLTALANAHLGDWDGAESIFREFRRSNLPSSLIWIPRAYLLNEKGGRTTVQGIVREHGGKTYLEVEKLDMTLQADKRSKWAAVGEFDHANVLFCFGGARAVHDF